MWRRRKVFIQIFIFLLIKVSRTQSNCDWEGSCSLTCNSNKNFLQLSPKKICVIMSDLDQIWTEHTACHEDGIDLKLENIAYPNNIVSPNFFTANVKVKTLTIKLNYIWQTSEKIETGAFSSDALKLMKSLVISNVMVESIRKGAFNGLVNLEVLKIDGRKLVIEAGVLDVLNGTLREFSLEKAASWTPNEEISVDGLTGAGAMDQLQSVKFKYKLASITRKTFAGVTNVKALDLSDCEIVSIGMRSFDSLQFLEILNLKGNLLTTITNGFFSNILIRNTTQIYLEGNRFICDCALMPFKMSLIEHSNFIGKLDCSEPKQFQKQEIIKIKFDDEICVLPTTTTSSPPSSLPPLQCQLPDNSETIFIDPPTHAMKIYQTDTADVVLRVDDSAENSILIWFSIDDTRTNLSSSVTTNCLIGSDPSFHIDNLVTNVAYTFCVMDRMEMKNSPLDCVSFVKTSDPNRATGPWLYHSAKSTFIGFTFVACFLGIFLGSAIGGLSYKMWMMKRKEPFIRRSQSSSRSRASFLSSRTTNTTIQYFINENFDAAPPPLPARPSLLSRMDEPVYATIHDIRSIWAATQDNVQASNELELKTI